MKQILTIILMGLSTGLFIRYIRYKHNQQPKIDYTIKVYQNKATLYDQSNKEVGTCTLDSIGNLIIKDNL